MKPMDLAKKLRRDAAFDPAALDRGKAVLMAAIQNEVAPRRAAHDRSAGSRTRTSARRSRSSSARSASARSRASRVDERGRRGRPRDDGVRRRRDRHRRAGRPRRDEPEERAASRASTSACTSTTSTRTTSARSPRARASRMGLRNQFWGDRTYEALDLEGHRWRFHQRRPRGAAVRVALGPGRRTSSRVRLDSGAWTRGVPKPTRDLAQAEQDLRDFGVCLLEGALPPEQLARVRDALYRAADDDRTRGREAKFGFDYAHDDTQPAGLEPALARPGLRRPGRAPGGAAPAEAVPGLADPALEHLGEHHRARRRRDGPARGPDLHARAVVGADPGHERRLVRRPLRRRERRDADRARQPQAEPHAHRRGASRPRRSRSRRPRERWS